MLNLGVSGILLIQSNGMKTILFSFFMCLSLFPLKLKAYQIYYSQNLKQSDSLLQKKLDILIRAGNDDYMKGELIGSIENYDKAIRLKPAYALAYYYRANSEFQLGLKAAACKDWIKAKQLGLKKGEDYLKKYCK
jgi:tetratricopeptide (TPR) repeat protein